MVTNHARAIAVLASILWVVLASPAQTPPVEQAPDLVVGLVASQPAVRFGEDLKIEVTLTNRGGKAIAIPPGGLRIAPSGWSAWGSGGSGWGSGAVLSAKGTKGDLVVPAGGSVKTEFTDREHTVISLGPITCNWQVRAENPGLQPVVRTPPPVTVHFTVRPSLLMESAWAAKTEEDRAKLLPEVKELLRLRAKHNDWQRRLVEGTFNYLAGSALPLLDMAVKDSDPLVRAQAIEQYRFSAWAVGNMNACLTAATQPSYQGKVGDWTRLVSPGDQKAAEEACIRTTLAGLKDADARVRISAVHVLTWKEHGPVEEVKKLGSDTDPGVRAAVLEYLALFGGTRWSADALTAALQDPSEEVRAKAAAALETSPEPPPPAALKGGLATTKGEAAIRLVALLYEQEDKDLPATLLEGFAGRDEAEKLAVLAALAGHADDATLEMAKVALAEKSTAVQRQGLLRLLPFSPTKAGDLLATYLKICPADLKPLADAVEKELRQREAFPFLGRASSGWLAAATEKEFHSRNGTVPMVSPDGERVAYVETGWGRSAGSGGFGRSNLISLVHVAGKDGKGDRVVSDMFLVGWMSDGRRVGSIRDGYAAVTDLDGNVVAEFGTSETSTTHRAGEWAKGQLRQQSGAAMPHGKRVGGADYAENAAISPDGKWLGPLRTGGEMTFLDTEGTKVALPGVEQSDGQATWSPDARRVLVWGWKAATVVDFPARKATTIEPVDEFPRIESWDYRKCRWNPWSPDGSRLAFLRGGQVWVCKPDGQEARQLTWGSRSKAFPTFSPDGKRVAYLCYQVDQRRHYPRLGPTDLWAVDVQTGLETRVTAPAPGRIHCLDWLDGETVIYDRVSEARLGYASALRTASLGAAE